MFGFFKEKCPVCGMKLEPGREYPEESGKKFCSESCRDKYRKEAAGGQSHKSHGCCH